MHRSPSDKLPLKGALSLMFLALLLCSLPIKDAFQPGRDEGYELLKGFMCSNGFSLYTDIWNDQPPLHTLVLSALFKAVGPALPAARTLAIAFGSLLLYSLMSVVWMRCGRCSALAAGTVLVISPLFLDLSFSVMLEVPAFATAMTAVWLMYRWLGSRHRFWLLLSGLVMGCALQIKFTAALVLPALVVELLMNTPTTVERKQFLGTIKAVLVWLSAVAAAFAAIAILSGETFQPMWESHTLVVSAAGQPVLGSGELRFTLQDLSDDLAMLAPAVLGLLAIVWRRAWRQMAFPLVFLATCLAVHLFHRPYWYYYHLHFLIPMAWIAGYGLAESAAALRSAIPGGITKVRFAVLWFGWLGICAGVTLALEGGPRLCSELDVLTNLPRAEDDTLLAKIRENAKSTRWFYSDENVYPFLARLRVPPELVVLVQKRFWSGQIDANQILSCVRRYRPEQVLLSGASKMSSEWEPTDGTNYFLAYEDGAYRLFVLKRIPAGQADPGWRER
jgi:hypothetical protein